MAKSVNMPNLSNATAGGIVDMCGPDQAELNRLTTLTKYYKAGLKARLDESMRIDPYTYAVKGEQYSATITDITQHRFNLALAVEKGYITPEQVEECTVPSVAPTVRFYKNEEAPQVGQAKEAAE